VIDDNQTHFFPRAPTFFSFQHSRPPFFFSYDPRMIGNKVWAPCQQLLCPVYKPMLTLLPLWFMTALPNQFIRGFSPDLRRGSNPPSLPMNFFTPSAFQSRSSRLLLGLFRRQLFFFFFPDGPAAVVRLSLNKSTGALPPLLFSPYPPPLHIGGIPSPCFSPSHAI